MSNVQESFMNAQTLLPVLALLAVSSAEAAPRKVIRGSFEMVVCTEKDNLNVRADNLRRVLFSVPNHETLKVFQGWGDNKRSTKIGGDEYTFIKVQFPNREARGQQSVGWVAEELVKPRSECPGAGGGDIPPGDEEPRQTPKNPPVKPEPGVNPGRGGDVSGLNDPACCQFPTRDEPTADFTSGQRRFGAGRSGGDRLHAACDLYRTLGEPISAVANGTVIRDKYFFYQGTYALEVRHGTGFVVRYGEVTGKNATGVGSGSKVKMGQTVAFMGKVNSNCCEPMLHFELFSGSRTGSLTGGGPYQRRGDLLNPTKYLLQWQENTFRSRK